jgi:hypothetical protein
MALQLIKLENLHCIGINNKYPTVKLISYIHTSIQYRIDAIKYAIIKSFQVTMLTRTKLIIYIYKTNCSYIMYIAKNLCSHFCVLNIVRKLPFLCFYLKMLPAALYKPWNHQLRLDKKVY